MSAVIPGMYHCPGQGPKPLHKIPFCFVFCGVQSQAHCSSCDHPLAGDHHKPAGFVRSTTCGGRQPVCQLVHDMIGLVQATSSALWSAACEARLKDGRIPSRENLMSALTGEMATTSGAPNMPADISVRVGGGPTAIRQALNRLQNLDNSSPPSSPMTR